MDDKFLNALPKGPFTLIACTEIRVEEGKKPDDWLNVWGVRAVDAEKFEPETSGYCGCLPLDAENKHSTAGKAVMVFERYSNGRAALDYHSNREAHKTFVDASLKGRLAKRMQIVGLAAQDSFGFTRPTRPPVKAAGTSGDGPVLRLQVFRFGSEADRDQFISILNEYCKYRYDNEPDCLTCYGGIVTADCPRGPPAKKGDVLFALEFTSQEADKKSESTPAHQEMVKNYQAAGIARELIFQTSYRVTPTGFMVKPANAGWHGAGADGRLPAKL